MIQRWARGDTAGACMSMLCLLSQRSIPQILVKLQHSNASSKQTSGLLAEIFVVWGTSDGRKSPEAV